MSRGRCQIAGSACPATKCHLFLRAQGHRVAATESDQAGRAEWPRFGLTESPRRSRHSLWSVRPRWLSRSSAAVRRWPAPCAAATRSRRTRRSTADLVNCPSNGIVIGADDITLDLNGHTIDGDDALVDPCPEERVLRRRGRQRWLQRRQDHGWRRSASSLSACSSSGRERTA